jgi:hypothetical protein
MGWFRRKNKPRVRGTARVVGVSRPPHNASFGNISMDLVVEGPGIPAYAHSYSKLIMAVSKWPGGGAVLPVDINPDDHDDVDIAWDEVADNSETSRDSAEALAALLRGESAGAPGAGVAAEPGLATTLASLQELFPGAVVRVASAPSESGLAVPGGVNVVAGNSGADPVERLEKLAKLHAAGIIDDAQMAQLKAQILEQAGIDGEA